MSIILSLLLLLLFTLFAGLIVILIIFIMDFIRDRYSMDYAMEELKKRCEKKSSTVKILNEIVSKMHNCPPIGNEISPFEVADFGNLRVLICGDENGRPRLFAMNIEDYTNEQFRQLIEKEKFRKIGIKHSISVIELSEFLTEVCKKDFEKKLKEKSRNNLIQHFKN